MKKTMIGLIGAALAFASVSASAATPLSATPFGDTVIANGSVPNVTAQPWGTTGDYFSTTGHGGITFGEIDPKIDYIRFVHGSVDTYNTGALLDHAGAVLKSFAYVGNGDQGPGGTFVETIHFKPGTVGGFAMSSSQPAFEAANFVGGVPEAATWVMLVVGFGAVGIAARRRSNAVTA